MKKKLGVVLLILVLSLVVASVAYAAVPTHQHYVLDEQGQRVQIGPNFCNYEHTDNNFTHFHTRVHASNLSLNAVGVFGEACSD